MITKDKVCKIKDSSNSGKYVFFDLYDEFYDEQFYNKDDKNPNPSQIKEIKAELKKVRRKNNNYEWKRMSPLLKEFVQNFFD